MKLKYNDSKDVDEMLFYKGSRDYTLFGYENWEKLTDKSEQIQKKFWATLWIPSKIKWINIFKMPIRMLNIMS